MLHGEGGRAIKIHQRFHHRRPSAATPPLPSLSRGATCARNHCKYHRSYPLAPRQAGLLFLVSVYAALAACTYKVRPQAHCVGLLDLGILVRGDGCAGGDRVTNGAGKASGLRGATSCGPSQSLSPVHAHQPREWAFMYRPPHDHHRLCL